MSRKKWIITAVFSFVILYILFGFWIVKDTKMILEMTLSADSHDPQYMNQTVFNNTNIEARGDTPDFSYEPASHKIHSIVPLHFFFVSKVFVTHKYEQPDFGFQETLTLDMKLKNGHWYAANVKFTP